MTEPYPFIPTDRDDRAARGEPTSGRHPVVIGHLVLGIALAGLLVVWALVAGHAVTGRGIRFLLPVPWVLAAAGGVVALRRARAR